MHKMSFDINIYKGVKNEFKGFIFSRISYLATNYCCHIIY